MKLAFYPDPVLLKPAERIEEITDEIRAKARAMIPFMELEGGVGLAAPQVSWGVQLLLASESGKPEETLVLINPTMTWKSKELEWGEEGCLSFPEIYGEVQRAVAIKVEAQDLDGNLIELEAEDFFARVLQHEIDHLNGDLFINKMRPADKAQNRAAILALKKKFEERQAQALD